MTALATDHAVQKLRGYQVAIRRERELRRSIFTPPPQYTVSEWADEFRMLTSIASAEPGRWRTERAPYQRGIMDAFCDPSIERVVVMSSAQVGKTEIVLNVIGYFIDQDPAPILVLQPTIEMARAFSKDRLREMLRASPRLQPTVRDTGRREADDTILHKQFPGGQITMAGANSAAGLASRPIRVVLDDEVDRFPPSAGDEGDPVSLAKKRTLTFWNRKEGLFSTPTVKGSSRIESAFEDGDQRRYHVACPHCAHQQHLRWAQLDFETASYTCEGCGTLIPETAKPDMLAAGEWIAAKPGGTTASFHLNALYSPWVTWRYLITEFLEAKKSPERLRTFVNTVLGETWETDGEGIDTDSLAARRETYAAEVPAWVGVLTAFVDVQREWLELLVKGWGAAQESAVIAHHRLRGNTALADVWERLDPLLLKGYQHESGAVLHITVCGVDSGDGENVQPVYRFVAPRQKRERCPVYATKGSSIRGRPIIAARPSKKNKYGVRVFPIGTDTAKDVIFPRLKLARAETGECPPGFMHFPKPFPHGGCDDEYLAQFGREKIQIKYSHGVPYRVYEVVPHGARNEAVDLEVGNLHMLHTLGAGVYDQLSAWVARVNREGAKARARQPAASAPPPSDAQPSDAPPTAAEEMGPEAPTPPIPEPPAATRRQPPRRPSSGYLNSWRR